MPPMMIVMIIKILVFCLLCVFQSDLLLEWCEGSIVVIGTDNRISKPSSSSSLVCCILFVLVLLGKVWIHCPSYYRLNSRADWTISLWVVITLNERQLCIQNHGENNRETSQLSLSSSHGSSLIIEKRHL